MAVLRKELSFFEATSSRCREDGEAIPVEVTHGLGRHRHMLQLAERGLALLNEADRSVGLYRIPKPIGEILLDRKLDTAAKLDRFRELIAQAEAGI